MGRAKDATLLDCMGIKIDQPNIFSSTDSRLIPILYTDPAATLHPSSKLHSQYLFHSACLIKAWRGIWPQWEGEEAIHRGYLCVQQGLENFSFKFLSCSLPNIFCDSTLEVLLGFWSSTETTNDKIEVMWRLKLKFIHSASWGENLISLDSDLPQRETHSVWPFVIWRRCVNFRSIQGSFCLAL